MILLYCRDLKVIKLDARTSEYKQETRTLSVDLIYGFGLSVKFSYGVRIIIGCIEICYLE